MTKKVLKKIFRIERFFCESKKNVFGRPRRAALRRRRRQYYWTGGAPPPQTEIDRRAAADTMTSAHSSIACQFVSFVVFESATHVRLLHHPLTAIYDLRLYLSRRFFASARRCLLPPSSPSDTSAPNLAWAVEEEETTFLGNKRSTTYVYILPDVSSRSERAQLLNAVFSLFHLRRPPVPLIWAAEAVGTTAFLGIKRRDLCER